MSYFSLGTTNPYPLDIFLTQRYQYTLEEDASSVAARLLSALSRGVSKGAVLAENGFRLGHPWRLTPTAWLDTQFAYLSGSLDPLSPIKLQPDPLTGEPQYKPRTLIDIRIRPNLFLVIIAYVTGILLIMDVLGIELFWRSNYLLRLGLYVCLELCSVWLIFLATGYLKKKFEKIMFTDDHR
jgi:hypothetical protein